MPSQLKLIPHKEFTANKTVGIISHWYLLQTIVVLIIVWYTLIPNNYDLKVPLQYNGDAFLILMYIKGITLNGWAWEIPQLSAPYQMSAAAFPLMTSFDWLIMKAIALFTDQPGLIINLFWLLSLVLTGWSAMLALQFLGCRLSIAMLAGVVYAFLPFALLRNISHLNLDYYLVPLLATLTLLIASNDNLSRATWPRRIMLLACVCQGFNYIYYSFFAVIILMFAAGYSYLQYRCWASVKLGAVAIALIIIATGANLTPSLLSWHVHGKPPEMDYKHPAEAEIYGAKIRRMLAPHQGNPLPLMGRWGLADVAVGYPNENENTTVRLGHVGAFGFILLLLISLGLVQANSLSPVRHELVSALAVLNLFCLLIITVGGFGAIFNLAIAQDIRAYNRFSVFIAFFATIAWVLFIERLYNYAKSYWLLLIIICTIFFASISLYDQLLDRGGLVAVQERNQVKFRTDSDFMNKFSEIYPKEVTTLQLPFTGFPPLEKHNEMESYDHLRPFLFSNKLMRWSWPSYSQRHRTWQKRLSTLPETELVEAAIYSGFNVIWIDRHAYSDHGVSISENLIKAGAMLVLENEHDVILDLNAATQTLKAHQTEYEFTSHQDQWINGPVLVWGKGFRREEKGNQGQLFRWSNKSSQVALENHSPSRHDFTIKFELASDAPSEISISSDKDQWIFQSNTIPKEYQIIIAVDANSSSVLDFSFIHGQGNELNKMKSLYFQIINPTVKITNLVE